MSYVDLMETILVKKEDDKPSTGSGSRLKKARTTAPQENSMDTTPIPEDFPSSRTMILRPLCNSPQLSMYENEPMCSD